MHTVSMIVAEPRSHWLPWVRALQDAHDQLVVVAQHDDEPHGALGTRVLRRIRQLRADGAHILRIALVRDDRKRRDASPTSYSTTQWMADLLAGASEGTRIVIDLPAPEHHAPRDEVEARAGDAARQYPSPTEQTGLAEPSRQAA